LASIPNSMSLRRDTRLFQGRPHNFIALFVSSLTRDSFHFSIPKFQKSMVFIMISIENTQRLPVSGLICLSCRFRLLDQCRALNGCLTAIQLKLNFRSLVCFLRLICDSHATVHMRKREAIWPQHSRPTFTFSTSFYWRARQSVYQEQLFALLFLCSHLLCLSLLEQLYVTIRESHDGSESRFDSTLKLELFGF
jgi:hypothetical protein